MPKLLFIESSPRQAESASSAVAQTFIEAYAQRRPDATVDRMDLWHMRLPEFDGETMQAKYAALRGEQRTPAQATAWDELSAIAERVRSADTLLIAVPMWNFGIPYKLKHLIDVVSQKDLLFTFDAWGFGGLCVARDAVVIYARGIDYGPDATFGTPGTEWDQQQPYMNLWLKFIAQQM
jgi:FMN-dependent NADH-azoreductase